MNCEFYFELISGHLDGQNTPEQETALQAHLSECAACRDTLALLSGLETQTSALRAEAPPELKGRVMDAIRSEAAAKQKRRRWLGPGAALGAVAAVLALLLGTGVVKLPQRSAMLEGVSEPVLQEAAELPDAAADATEASPRRTEAVPAETAAAAEPVEDSAPATANGYFAEAPAAVEEQKDAALPERTEAGPAATEPAAAADSISRRGITQQSLLTSEDNDYCAALSCDTDAPVIACFGLDEDFPNELAALEPTLGELLQNAPRTVEDGRIVLELDVDTLFALQEWLLLHLPEDAASEEAREDAEPVEAPAETEEAFPSSGTPLVTAVEEQSYGAVETAEGALSGIVQSGVWRRSASIRRLSEFDPDLSCLTTLIEFELPERLETLPEDWPEDFARRFLAQSNWALYYPAEDYAPAHGETAYLVLIPPTEPAETAAATNSD